MVRCICRFVSGFQNYSKIISEAIDKIGKSAWKVIYPSGYQDGVDVAVHKSVVTEVNKCFADLNLIRAKQNGYSHVLVSSHLGARHIENPSPEYLSHDIWQGEVYEVDWDIVSFVKIHKNFSPAAPERKTLTQLFNFEKWSFHSICKRR